MREWWGRLSGKQKLALVGGLLIGGLLFLKMRSSSSSAQTSGANQTVAQGVAAGLPTSGGINIYLQQGPTAGSSTDAGTTGIPGLPPNPTTPPVSSTPGTPTGSGTPTGGGDPQQPVKTPGIPTDLGPFQNWPPAGLGTLANTTSSVGYGNANGLPGFMLGGGYTPGDLPPGPPPTTHIKPTPAPFTGWAGGTGPQGLYFTNPPPTGSPTDRADIFGQGPIAFSQGAQQFFSFNGAATTSGVGLGPVVEAGSPSVPQFAGMTYLLGNAVGQGQSAPLFTQYPPAAVGSIIYDSGINVPQSYNMGIGSNAYNNPLYPVPSVVGGAYGPPTVVQNPPSPGVAPGDTGGALAGGRQKGPF